MTKLLMISGDRSLAQGKKGAFYNTLEEFHKYWERIDIIIPMLFAHHGGPPVESPLAFFDNVFVHPSPWPLIWQPFWILKKGQQIYWEHKFDLMTVHEYPPFYNGIGARWLWNKIGIPYVLEIFHIPGHPKAAGFKEAFYKKLSRIFLKFDSSRARAVRTMNQKQVPDFLLSAGVPKEKIVYIPAIYIDLDIFKPMNPVRGREGSPRTKQDASRTNEFVRDAEHVRGFVRGSQRASASNGVNLEKKYDLIFVGRLVKNKGINLFLEAVKILGCKAVIVGDGPLKESLKSKVKSLKLENNIIFYGWAKDQAEVAKLLNMSKILVMPSYNEGGPRVVLEAMACGVPVLATPVGIVPDVIKDGESGRIIGWDPREISEKAQILLNNQSEYEKYKETSKKMVGQFEKKSAIRNYAEKLQELSTV